MLIMLNQSGIVAYSNERQLQVVSDFHLTQIKFKEILKSYIKHNISGK